MTIVFHLNSGPVLYDNNGIIGLMRHYNESEFLQDTNYSSQSYPTRTVKVRVTNVTETRNILQVTFTLKGRFNVETFPNPFEFGI